MTVAFINIDRNSITIWCVKQGRLNRPYRGELLQVWSGITHQDTQYIPTSNTRTVHLIIRLFDKVSLVFFSEHLSVTQGWLDLKLPDIEGY